MANIKISEEKINIIKDVCKSFGNKSGEVINVLHQVQGKFGYLPAEVQEVIAHELNMPVAKVYGIVSFYSFFTMEPKGEHPIDICLGTACYVRGAEKVLDAFQRNLGIQPRRQVQPEHPPLRRCLRSRPRRHDWRQGLRPPHPRPRPRHPRRVQISQQVTNEGRGSRMAAPPFYVYSFVIVGQADGV